MHLLVTDRLSCVRCGPEFGLILLADRLEDRRVLEGRLGCANCRETYPVVNGFGDFRGPTGEEVSTGTHGGIPEPDPEEAFRLAALLGVTEGPGLLLLAGPSVGQAERIVRTIEEIEVVVLHPGVREAPETEGVTRIAAGVRLPFRTGSLRGVVWEGPSDEDRLREAVRVLAPGSRLVLRPPGEGEVGRLEGFGLELLLQTGKAVVAARPP